MANSSSEQRSRRALVGSPIAEVGGLARGIATLPAVLLPGGPSKGDGGPVLVLPGYLTGDWSTLAIRAYLSRLGYRVSGWGQGTNRGDIASYTREVTRIVRKRAESSGQQVRLVGWSLGGTIGREVARTTPDAVRQVVTLGSPTIGAFRNSPTASNSQLGRPRTPGKAGAARHHGRKSGVPVTALYSKKDSVVSWRAALDSDPDSETNHIEISGTHFELGVSPSVLRMVGRILAQPR